MENGLKGRHGITIYTGMAETPEKFTGRIYMIMAFGHEGCYIGSTTLTLQERFRLHKVHYNMYRNGLFNYMGSFDILKHEGATIHQLHEGKFDSKRDMEKLEGHFIDITAGAVNKKGAGMTRADSNHKYYMKNREHRGEHSRVKFECDVCNGKYTRQNKAQHCRTKKHMLALEEQRENESNYALSLWMQQSV
jgi:hypothetical protein